MSPYVSIFQPKTSKGIKLTSNERFQLNFDFYPFCFHPRLFIYLIFYNRVFQIEVYWSTFLLLEETRDHNAAEKYLGRNGVDHPLPVVAASLPADPPIHVAT